MTNAFPLSEAELRRRKVERRDRTRRIQREQQGPLPAQRCGCENPALYADSDGTNWCVWCGRES
jgi:hypothetical protein